MLGYTTMQTSSRNLCLFLLFGISALSASAQSFDCAKAIKRYEKFICANRDLSEADSRMAAAYNAALVQLSEEGRRRLVESQRSWLKYGLDTSKLDVHYLKGIYGYRTKQLEKTLQTAGPFNIQSLTMYNKAKITNQAAREQDRFSYRFELSFPRIESPSTAETERWNRLVEEHIRKFAGQPETDAGVGVYFEITYASQDIISLVFQKIEFAAGFPHPSYDGGSYIALLRSGRELQASDLFTPAKPWKAFLNGIVFRKLKAQAAKRELYLTPSSAAEIDADAVKRWTITKQGLQISFDELGDHAHGGYEVVVSWAELKPYLNPAMPFLVPQP
jgi:uncharacterized protein